mgnify:CR=1 FL=1
MGDGKAANPQGGGVVADDTMGVALLGEGVGANILMMGYAWQAGLVPLQLASLEAAIELNGVAIDFNKRAFALGRLLAARPDKVEAMVAAARGAAPEPVSTTLDGLVAKSTAYLTAYQSAASANRSRIMI